MRKIQSYFVPSSEPDLVSLEVYRREAALEEKAIFTLKNGRFSAKKVSLFRHVLLPALLLSFYERPRCRHRHRLCPRGQKSCRDRDPWVLGDMCEPDGSVSEDTGVSSPALFITPMGPVTTTPSEALRLTLQHWGSTAQQETTRKYRSPPCLRRKDKKKWPPLALDEMLSRSLSCSDVSFCLPFVRVSPPSFLSHYNASRFAVEPVSFSRSPQTCLWTQLVQMSNAVFHVYFMSHNRDIYI